MKKSDLLRSAAGRDAHRQRCGMEDRRQRAQRFAYHAAIADIDGKTYVITLAAPAAIVEQITAALLYPALDAFAPNAGS